jgi:WD40 repeat protein
VAVYGHLPELAIVDVATGQAHVLRGHTDQIYHAEWAPGGDRLLTASDDGTVRVWDLVDGTSRVFRGHDDDVVRAHFSPDQRAVASASLDGTVRVWPLEPEAHVLREGAAISELQVTGDRAIVRTANTIARWDLGTGQREQLFAWPHESGEPSPDGEHLVVRRHDALEVRHAAGAPTVLAQRALVSHVEWGAGRVFTSSYDGSLRSWDPMTGEATTLLSGDAPIRGFAVAADGRIAARVGDALEMLDGATRTPLGDGCVLAMRFEPLRDRLVVYRCNHSLEIVGDRVIDLATGSNAVARWAVAPDRIAAAIGNRTIVVWDDSGTRLAELRGHTDLVLDVAFSPDGTRLASASYDKTIRVWDLATGTSRVLRGHGAAVERVWWRSPGELISGSDDGTLRIWQAPPSALPSAADIAQELDASTTAEIDARDRATTMVGT